MEDCIFCKIVKGEAPSYKIYEDENYFAFLDLFPHSKGHTLVIPKKHYDTVWEIPEKGEYFEVLTKVRENMRRELNVDYVDMAIFGRGVSHAHTHLIPLDGDWKRTIEYVGELKSEKLDEKSAEELVDKLSMS
ncbi:MAG TPA: HIT domain-containing protein [bacterium]|nr:HIT domain-containing protein [bacterium]